MLRKLWQSRLVFSLLAFGCDDPGTEQPDFTVEDGAYAVVSSDWTATAISVLDAQGNLIADNYLNSGSVKSGLVAALSGDVELPERSGESGVMVILDRFRTDVITRIRLSDGVVLGQLKTHTPPEQATMTSYSSNPHDYVMIDPTTAYVTRNEPNLDPNAKEIDRGDDLLKINPATMTRSEERIDLSPLATKVTRTDPVTGTTSEVQLYARPSRMVRVGDTLVVGLGRTAFDFKAVGEGMVALVNLDTKAVTGFALEGLKNCSDVGDVPNDPDTVLVSCAGDYNADPKESAGLVLLGVANGTAAVEHVWRAKDDSSAKPLASSAVSLGGTLVGAAANDYSKHGSDVYAVIDLATKTKTEIKSLTPGSGAWGIPAFNAASGLLLIPDATVDANKKPLAGVRRFQRNADGSFAELATITVAASTNMPARYVFPL